MSDRFCRIERLQIIQNIRAPKRRVYLQREDPFVLYNDKEFIKRFRLQKNTVHWLANELDDQIGRKNGRGRALTSLQKVLIALRFYATGSFHRVGGDLMKVHESTACRVIKSVSLAIAGMRKRFIQFPDDDELLDIQAQFQQLSGDNFPGIIGAIDCTHVKLMLPNKDHAKRYYCRKQYYSLNVQAIGDAKLRIRNIVCRWPGVTHDSRIYTNSTIKHIIEQRNRGHLLGDGGYACTRYMLTPYSKPVGAAQTRYNKAQIKARNSVERLFGILKARFPCLGQTLRLKVKTCQAVIVACAVLHNIAIAGRDYEFPEVTYAPRLRMGQPTLPDEVGSEYRETFVQQHFR